MISFVSMDIFFHGYSSFDSAEQSADFFRFRDLRYFMNSIQLLLDLQNTPNIN